MTYTLSLTEPEVQTLAWIAERYTCAEILYHGMLASDDDAGIWLIAEHVAWEYAEAVAAENGDDSILPPCVGGTLADKLLEFYGSIV